MARGAANKALTSSLREACWTPQNHRLPQASTNLHKAKQTFLPPGGPIPQSSILHPRRQIYPSRIIAHCCAPLPTFPVKNFIKKALCLDGSKIRGNRVKTGQNRLKNVTHTQVHSPLYIWQYCRGSSREAALASGCYPHQIDNFLALLHSARMSKSALGRGLGALLGGPITPPAPASSPAQSAAAASAVADSRERVQRVPLNKVHPSALQPAQTIFRRLRCGELADSIREQGIVQPLIVRPSGDSFELIAGERRWRAAQLLNLPEVPIIAREADDRTVLELALIENLQRENLNPIEEALGYSQLAGQFQLTQEEISAKVGKSRAAVANALRLLKLPQSIQDYVRQGQLSVGHAKVILGLTDEKSQRLAAEQVVKGTLNVRQTEGLVAKWQSPGEKEPSSKLKAPATPSGDPHVTDLESRLRELFATKVKLNYSQGKGSLEISFFSNEELERILQVLGVSRG